MVKVSVLAAIAALSFCVVAGQADARTRHAHGVFAGSHGRTVTGDATTTAGRGFRDRTATWTGPNGGQRNVNDQRTWDRQAGTYNHDRDTTFADGTTRSAATDVQRTAPGQYDVNREVTHRNGETTSQSGQVTITH